MAAPSSDYERTRTSSLKYQPEPQLSPHIGSSTDELFFPIQSQQQQQHPIGGNKKDKKKAKEKKSQKGKNKKKVGAEPEQDNSVVRTASLPNFLDEQDPFAGGRSPNNALSGTLTIFLESANLPDGSQKLRTSLQETSAQIINRLLATYGRTQHIDSYCLEQVNIPPRGENLP